MQTFAYSSAPVKRVREVQLGVLSPEEIVCVLLAPVKISNSVEPLGLRFTESVLCRQIEFPEVMDETGHKPRQNGLADSHMGAID